MTHAMLFANYSYLVPSPMTAFKNMYFISIVNHIFLLDAFCTIGLGLSVKVSFLLMKAITSYSVLGN